MPHFPSPRRFLITIAVASITAFAHPSSARAEGYAGAMIGLGIPMGTGIGVDSGTVYGATVGYRLLPLLAFAGTYLHDGFKTTVGSLDYTSNQYLLEANFFSLLFMNAGLHAGSVDTKVIGSSTSDLGYGVHLGFDFKLTEMISVGGAGYWTYVTASDKYSTLNVMVPLKIWF